jgi:flagellar protein FlbD
VWPIKWEEMIELHRLGRTSEPFHLNPDLIVSVEAQPDTHIALTTGANLIVNESPEQVVEEIRAWRAGVLADALAAKV